MKLFEIPIQRCTKFFPSNVGKHEIAEKDSRVQENVYVDSFLLKNCVQSQVLNR